MKKTMIKAVLTATMLFSAILGQGVVTNTAAAKPVVTAPVMTDNLSKYGLIKDVELPVTITAGGLSYTLEKIMIYDINSATAQALIKKYGYNNYGSYLVWTKITIENKSTKVIQESAKDPNPKWFISPGDGGVLLQDMPRVKVKEKNSKEALWDYTLKPGQKLTTYQAFLNTGSFKYLKIWLNVNGSSQQKYIVNRKE